jgi:hypothetical protein
VDCFWLAVIIASCAVLLWINKKWRDWINR